MNLRCAQPEVRDQLSIYRGLPHRVSHARDRAVHKLDVEQQAAGLMRCQDHFGRWIVKRRIVLVDRINQLRHRGNELGEAVIRAGSERLRPILMTTTTTVLGLTPMALGLGEGAELRAPLAVTVISGLLLATLLTLVVVPVIYTLLSGRTVLQTAGSPVEHVKSPVPDPGSA